MLPEIITKAYTMNNQLNFNSPPEHNTSDPAPPYEIDEIMLMFGDIFDCINNDGTIKPKWELDQMGLAYLPFAIPLAACPSIEVDKIYCHKKLISTFTNVFRVIQERNLRPYVRSYGACFNYRSKYNDSGLSTHSWGIAIDLNPETNLPGTRGDMHPEIVEIFQSYGFEWGGSWKRREKNPMHFQWCTGY
ncbi:M15 family metallopeptidase [bacterium]|nr:M15 family metallopeptidase [bacterium]